jgi:hypothetical protein
MRIPVSLLIPMACFVARFEGRCDAVLFSKDASFQPSNDPASNLSNGGGLPASPFRTDSWADLTSEPTPP